MAQVTLPWTSGGNITISESSGNKGVSNIEISSDSTNYTLGRETQITIKTSKGEIVLPISLKGKLFIPVQVYDLPTLLRLTENPTEEKPGIEFNKFYMIYL